MEFYTLRLWIEFHTLQDEQMFYSVSIILCSPPHTLLISEITTRYKYAIKLPRPILSQCMLCMSFDKDGGSEAGRRKEQYCFYHCKIDLAIPTFVNRHPVRGRGGGGREEGTFL